MRVPGLIPLLIVLALAFLLFSRPDNVSSLMEDFGTAREDRGFLKVVLIGVSAGLTIWAAAAMLQFFGAPSRSGRGSR